MATEAVGSISLAVGALGDWSESAPMRRRHQQGGEAEQQHLKQRQTDKPKGKTQETREGAKCSEEKVKEKTKEPIPSDKKNR